jgi:hypothetical protein
VRWLKLLRTLPPWRQAVYWVASIAALALVIWDFVDEGAQYTSIVVLALVVIGTVALRAPSRRSGGGHQGIAGSGSDREVPE